MNYPLISEYIEAIRFAEDNFDKLSNLRPVLDSNGNPVMSSGNFAVVFKMKDIDTDKLYAVKCFTREQEEREERYREIIKVLDEIKSPYFVPTHYYDKELFVDTSQDEETEFPVLVMDWVEGMTLDRYMKTIEGSQFKRELLAKQFQKLVCWLLPKHFAHGDLKPDNILVKDDCSIVLVDYDGMFVPSLYGKSALEVGTPMFRYKNRTLDDFNEHIDDYAIVFILLILKIGVTQPNVMDDFQNKDNQFDVFKSCVAFLDDKQIAPIISAYIMVANSGYLDCSLASSLIADRTDFNPKKEMDLLYSARQGNTKDMIELAKLYREGNSVVKNIDRSMKWYDLALKLGDSNAACGFCICLRRDPDISSLDYEVLFEKLYKSECNFACCRKGKLSNNKDELQNAAERGFVPALYGFGERYEYLFKDKDKAIEYYTKAAEEGYIIAMHALRRLYKDNAVESIKWLKRLAHYGNAKEQCELGLEYYNGNIISEDISKAIYWFEKAAKQEDEIAMYYLGEIYFNEDKYKDSSKAVYWWRKAAEIGQIDAQGCLAQSYYDGDGIKRDVSKAIYWYEKAAKQGDESAMNDLGIIYYNEYKDSPNAVYWWQKAAENGDIDAKNNLARCYLNSFLKSYLVFHDTLTVEQFRARMNVSTIEVRKNPKTGKLFITYGAKIGSVAFNSIPQHPMLSNVTDSSGANFWLLHEEGQEFGVETDLAKAVYWWQKAAEEGSSDAEYNLELCCKRWNRNDIVNVNPNEIKSIGECNTGSYSDDGKRFLCYWGTYGDEFKVEEGTEVLCDDCFNDLYSECDGHYLKTLYLPKTLKRIGNNVFCASISYISCESPNFKVENGFLLSHDEAILYRYYGNEKVVNVPNGVKYIKGGAFSEKDVEKVIIPNTVMHIGDNPFVGCRGITEIISNSTRFQVRYNTLYDVLEKRLIGCWDYTALRIYIQEGTLFLGKNAFFGLDIQYIEIPDSIEAIDETAFYRCLKLCNIAIPSNNYKRIYNLIPSYLRKYAMEDLPF